MAHEGIQRKGQGVAVLCIHGILGTPDHFNDFIPLIPTEWAVTSLLLEGHGKNVKDFGQASMSQWKKQVADELIILEKSYPHILLLAHSMGCLFAFEQARLHSSVEGLFLLAPPMNPTLRFPIVVTALKLLCGIENPQDEVTKSTKKAYSITISRKMWEYLPWIPNYIDLFREISLVRGRMSEMKQEAWVYFSQNDELVKVKSRKYIEKIPHHQVDILPQSRHFYYDTEDMSFLQREFSRFCTKYREKIEPDCENSP